MEISKFIDDTLCDLCLDSRIPNGIFDIENKEHILILKEYLINSVGLDITNELFENLVKEGNFPERQAYNKDGVLVTFPDAEAKKAAIKRKSHFESDPTGGAEDETSDDGAVEEEPEEEKSIFTDYEKPEDESSEKSEDEDEDVDISLDDDKDFEGEVHHVYDILDSIEKMEKSEDGVDDSDVNVEKKILSGELHPTILFALKQKWTFDKGGNWHDETGKFRASTDRRGQLDPSRSEDKEEMLMWLDDYMKRKKSKASE